MSQTIKCMKLDLLLLKPYIKSMFLVLLVPLVFPIFTGSLFEGLSFAATVMAMTTGYTFSISEKNDLNRFYGFLPVKKKNLVSGRYLAVYFIGFAALIFTVAIQVVILHFMSNRLSVLEIASTFFICCILFSIYAGTQIPGYYRFGSIKGKIFMFIPTVGFLLFYCIIQLIIKNTESATDLLLPGMGILIGGGVVFIIMIIGLSLAISVKIVEKGMVLEH